MTIDPFANADTEPAEAPNTDNTTTVSQKENSSNMTVSDQGKIVTTIKHGAGYDAPWTVIHANSAAEAKATMNDPEFKELLELTSKVSSSILPKQPASAPAGRSGQPAAAAAAPSGETPPEGYVFKSGISKKTGKPWKAFMPIDRNSGLEAIWLRD